jgi:signal transduction histidine kinase
MRLDRQFRGVAVDAAIAAATLVFVLGGELTPNGPGLSLGVAALDVLACGALVARRRYPILVLILTLAISAVSGSLGGGGGPIFLTFVVAVYTAAAEGRLQAAIVLAAVGMLGMISRQMSGGPRSAGGNEENAILIVGWMVAVLAVGGVSWNRRAYLAEVERRALDAERSRDADGRRRATEERMRIARELHDLLAHNISLINVRAGAALFHLTEAMGPDGSPRGLPDGDGGRPGLRDELVDALTVIRDAGRDAGREMRATLGVLRYADEGASTAPAPGLARLPDLVNAAARAGLHVRTTVEGAPRQVPAEVDLAGYRIIHEALTNVARHADTEAATVRIRYDADDVVIQVENGGAPALITCPVMGSAGCSSVPRRSAATCGRAP